MIHPSHPINPPSRLLHQKDPQIHHRGEREWLLGIWEGDREWTIPFPKFRNGKGMEKTHSQNSGTGREWKNPFPKFGNGNQRPPFLGMTGNGNSRSPLDKGTYVENFPFIPFQLSEKSEKWISSQRFKLWNVNLWVIKKSKRRRSRVFNILAEPPRASYSQRK